MIAHPAPGGYLIGAGFLLIGGALLWHVTHEWRRVWAFRRQALAQARLVRAQSRRWAITQQQARNPHPATRHRPVRVVRPVLRSVAPRPRPAPDQTRVIPGLADATMLLPTVTRAEQIPPQRGAFRG